MTRKSGRLGRSFVVSLGIGILLGFGLAYLIIANPDSSDSPREEVKSIVEEVTHNGRLYQEINNPRSHAALENATGPEEILSMHSLDEPMHKGEDTKSKILAHEVKVLCWVLTNPSSHKKKAIHVKHTWGHRCNKLLFMSSTEDTELPSVALEGVEEGRDFLWAKTKGAFKLLYDEYLEEADWFLKTDDDTYVIVENLRFLLKDYDPNYPIYFGCKFKPYINQGYMSGGAGYVLSKGALKKFVEEALPDSNKCRQDHGGDEDVEMGDCLQNVGVEAGDSRDSLGRHRFFPFPPEEHVVSGPVDETYWFWKYLYYPQRPDMNGCSDTAISFHYITPNQMYVLDYLIYHLWPYGITRNYPDDTKQQPSTTSSIAYSRTVELEPSSPSSVIKNEKVA